MSLRHLFYCRKCDLNFFGEDIQAKCPKCKQLIIAKSCCKEPQNYTKQKEIIVEIEKIIDVRG